MNTNSKLNANNRMRANDRQTEGDHWVKRPIQVWDFIAANNLDYFQGNVVKYTVRHQDKAGKTDLLKAIHYLEKLIELKYGTPKGRRRARKTRSN